MIETIFFYIFAILAVVSAISVITSKSPIHSAISLIVTLLQVAAIFILLRAPFLAAVQVFVYVGAVVVLFLFAVMLLDLGGEKMKAQFHQQTVFGVISAVGLFAVLIFMLAKSRLTAPTGGYTEAVLAKNTEVIGKVLFTKYIYPFEVVSLLLLVALVGAVILVLNQKSKHGA
jgi:NADH-quinone oxidoreductase subunit J